MVVSGRHGALETWWNAYTAADWEKADRLLARGGVGSIGDRPFGVISEGERQQVLLARALMSDPELLLLDEPFAGLDLGARERLLVRWQRWPATPASPPIVLVTHHCEEIPPGFTHGGLVPAGALVAAGPAARRRHLGARLGLLRGAGHGGVHRRAVVESRHLTDAAAA